MTYELAKLPENVREAIEEIDGAAVCRSPEWETIRAELLRLASSFESAEQFGRNQHERAERAEAELAALKRSPQGTVQAVRPQADGCYLVEVRCDSAGVASLFSQRVALLPVGGEG